jgi:hypothetical protein
MLVYDTDPLGDRLVFYDVARLGKKVFEAKRGRRKWREGWDEEQKKEECPRVVDQTAATKETMEGDQSDANMKVNRSRI